MKKILISLLLVGSSAFAQSEIAPDQYVDLLLLQLQNRFEDSSSQERTNRQYQAYGLAVQYSVFRGEFEFNQFYDKTGNEALSKELTIREFDLGMGYRVYQLISDDRRLSLNGFAKLWLGRTQTTIDTTFVSSQSSDQSDPEYVYGIGASVMARLTYFIAEADFKYLNSKNFTPQNVPVFTVKIGASIPY